MLGYVATDYGRRDHEIVVRRSTGTPLVRLSGIFLDEVSSTEAALPYTRPQRRCGARIGRSPSIPVICRRPEYFALADIVVTFEGRYADYRNWSQAGSVTLGGLINGADREPRLRRHPRQAQQVRHTSRADYVYATPGTMPNPWRWPPPTLPPGRPTAQCG